MPGIGITINREFLTRFARFAYTCMTMFGLDVSRYEHSNAKIPYFRLECLDRFDILPGDGYVVSAPILYILWYWTEIANHPSIAITEELPREMLSNLLRVFLLRNGITIDPDIDALCLLTFDCINHQRTFSGAVVRQFS